MESKDFPLQGSITYELVAESHKRILMISKEIKKVLNKHDIPYSIFFGTLIGAVRHKGFVPWDLDMDFGIFDNYGDVVKILKAELPSWLVVLDNSVDPNYCASWVKIVDRFSEFHATTFGGDNKYRFRGLHVDLYNIKRTTHNAACEYRRQEALDYYMRKLKAGTIKEDEYKELCLKVEADYRTEKTELTICEPDQPVLAFLKFFEGNPECVFPLKEYEFEGETYMGPNDHDQFLKSCYYKGNYMELPPYEKRDMKMDWIKISPLPL